MIVIPAIDLIDGKPVRLYQGDYSRKETVADSAYKTALAFEKAGAKRIHIVDLDGAKSGRRVNDALIADIAQSVHVPVETGGGIRNKADIEWYLDHGVSYVILGTAALEDKAFLKQAAEQFGEKIIVSLDCENGYAKGNGWLEESRIFYIDFAKQLSSIGIRNIVFTDIARDGTLKGPNLSQLEALQKTVPEMKITASGGISSMDDLRALKKAGMYAAITGKAVYSGKIDLKEAVAEMEGNE